MWRCGDSNPSPVYQVELYNDGGVAYPIVRLHELVETSRKAYTKSMKNLIRISPRITQAIVNEQASGLIDENGLVQTPQENNIVLGIEDEPLFEGEYTPVGKVLYGLEVLKKIKHQRHSEYILRPDFINTFRMLN